jgi:large subunit ribosomal protein L18
MAKSKLDRRSRIRKGIRKKLQGTSDRPRLSVFRSNSGIYAQVIDDVQGHTLASVSSRELGFDKNVNVDKSKEVGKKLAEKALEAGISQIVFDRGGYLYHGKVKALADGAREGGLKF